MPDELETILRLVAEGRLTAAQAAPILDALADADDDRPASGREPSGSPVAPDAPRRAATSIRIEITDHGRKTVNLRVPVSLGRFALDRVPGLSGTNVDLIRRALADGRSGTILDIDDDGSTVRIGLE